MEWASITGSWRYHKFGEGQPGLSDVAPNEGSLPHRQVRDLAKALCEHTGTLPSSFVGGTKAAVNASLSDPELDVMRVTADTKLTADADTINPEPAGRSPYS
jgi:hypothetical protein